VNIEHKALNCEFKAAGDDGSFELYALAFNNVDRQGDLIVPGAVSNTAELVSDGWGALNHMNSALPVAYPESATQDAKGLLVRLRRGRRLVRDAQRRADPHPQIYKSL
jgi:hypothetical protein